MKKVIIGNRLIHLKSVDSTNNYASSLLLNESTIEGTVILSDYQKKGKGQGTNKWISERNANLLFSIILKPTFIPANSQYFLSMSISNGLIHFFSEYGNSKIKWPNDILLNDKKIAGILIENSIMGSRLHTSVIGIGININQEKFPENIPYPTSLFIETSKKSDLKETFGKLMNVLSLYVNQFYNEDYINIKTSYLNNLWRLNEWFNYSDASGKFEGKIIDITESGELMLMLKDGKINIYGFKQISFL